MPIHKVQAPDGNIIKVEAPEGADPADIIAFAQSNYKPKEAPVNTGLQDAAKETGVGQSMAIGAGRSADKMVQGIRQAWNELVSQYGPDGAAQEARRTLAGLATQEQDKNRAYAPLSEEHPFATGIGETAPLLGIPGGANIPVQMGIAAAMGASKYGSPTDRVKEGVLDAAGTGIGSVVGKVLGKAIAPVNSNVINETRTGAMDAMVEHGYKPRLSQVTGSPNIEAVERWASNSPGGRGVLRGHEAANEIIFNKVAAKSIGQDATELSDKVLGAAKTELGKVFQDIKSLPGKPIEIDANVANAANEILREQNKLLPAQRNSELVKLATSAERMSALKTKIDGEAYQLQRSALSDAVDSSDGMVRNQYRKLLTALDDAAEQSLQNTGNTKLAASLREVRPKYANLKTLEKGSIVKGGDVSPQKLASKPTRNELTDVANFGDAFSALPKPFPTQSALEAVTNAILTPASYMGALATTNPLLTAYARHIGGTTGARAVAEDVNRVSRSVVDAAVQKRLNDLRTNR